MAPKLVLCSPFHVFGKGYNDEAVAEGRNHQRVTHKGLISRTARFTKRPVVTDGIFVIGGMEIGFEKTFPEKKKHEKKITDVQQNCF